MTVKNLKKKLALFFILLMAFCLTASAFYYMWIEFNPAFLSKAALTGLGTVFTDRYGKELRFLPDVKGERARWVPLAGIPVTVRNAFIAAEDERFYRHHGFDAIAILRALWSNVTKGRVVSGASTISQQVVRLVYSSQLEPPLTQPSPLRGEDKGEGARRTYRNKLIEIIRSIKMERVLSKDEILEQYLNRVPMGNNLVGVETAARAYFGVSVNNLSASDAALLASLPKAPGMLNPYGSGYPRLLERRNWVLGRMEALGLMSHDKYLTAKDEQPRLRKLNFVSAAPHVIDMLQKQSVEGGRIKTTIDLDLQTRVQQILASHADRLKYREATQAAAIVIHNPTMEVLAAAGSIAHSEKNDGFNIGVLAQRSAGSTLKPFLYALAIESGETVSTLIEDTERTYRSREGQYSPLNFDRKEYGPVKMRAALGNSLNLSAVKMLQRVGEERFYDMLVRLDLINHPERGPEHYGLGMAIGNPEVSPEQLATAYAMLANYGIYCEVKYGSAQPSIFNVARNAQALGYKPLVDLEAVKPVERHFAFIAKREGHPMGAQREYDHAQYLHQVPGGMISNLRHQLRTMGMENKLPETLEECGRVRAEFGYPIMVTPLAQFVGSQAAINVITGERYKEVTDQSIQYALGHWGKEAPTVMDSNVKDKILGRPRAKEWQKWSAPELSLHGVRQKFGGPGVSDEELVLRVIAGEAAVKAMLAAGAPKEYLTAAQPLVRLIGELVNRRDCLRVFIRKHDLSLRLENRKRRSDENL